LQQKIFFKKHFNVIPEQTLTAEPLQENKYYTVNELLQSMIINSDNDAVALLNQNINIESFKLLFRVLGFREPEIKSWDYYLTAVECSRFLRLLFNATYLNEKNSEYAMKMLTETKYREGFMKYIGTDIKVAHKFGERNVNNEQQLHETGIFYLDDKPYLLTVMTKGNDKNALPSILADISKMTLTYFRGKGV
jgi:beta-lactamase class A